MTSYREYKDHEFCLAIHCTWIAKGKCTLKYECCYSAKFFHIWLKENGFQIIKKKN